MADPNMAQMTTNLPASCAGRKGRQMRACAWGHVACCVGMGMRAWARTACCMRMGMGTLHAACACAYLQAECEVDACRGGVSGVHRVLSLLTRCEELASDEDWQLDEIEEHLGTYAIT